MWLVERMGCMLFCIKQKTAYAMRISDWSSDVCSSDLPIGFAALDLARIEAGFVVCGTDFKSAQAAVRPTRGRTPFELGAGRLVDFDKGHFNGRRALLQHAKDGPGYQLVGLEVAGNKPALNAYVYHRRKKEAGHVTRSEEHTSELPSLMRNT